MPPGDRALVFITVLLFRDAKQFMGLSQCQARSDAKLDFHLNANMSGLNLARLALAGDKTLGQSLNALVRRATGRLVYGAIYRQLSPMAQLELTRLDASQWQFWEAQAA